MKLKKVYADNPALLEKTINSILNVIDYYDEEDYFAQVTTSSLLKLIATIFEDDELVNISRTITESSEFMKFLDITYSKSDLIKSIFESIPFDVFMDGRYVQIVAKEEKYLVIALVVNYLNFGDVTESATVVVNAYNEMSAETKAREIINNQYNSVASVYVKKIFKIDDIDDTCVIVK